MSYKLNVEAKKKNKTIDEMLSDYQISKSHYKRIKKAMSYPLELKEVVEKIGITKAEALNKIIEILKKDTEISEIIERYIDCDREMLTHELKLLKKDKSIAILFGSTSVFYASQSLIKLKNILLKKGSGENG